MTCIICGEPTSPSTSEWLDGEVKHKSINFCIMALSDKVEELEQRIEVLEERAGYVRPSLPESALRRDDW